MNIIDEHYVIQFKAKLQLAAQQTVSRLESFCETIAITGEKAAYDGLGTVEARESTSRYERIKTASIEHLRRRITGKMCYVSIDVDEKDLVQILSDPSGKYSMAMMASMNRKKDMIIARAALASVYTGKDMDTLTTFANDGGLTVDATAGLVKEKLDEINRNFIDNDVNIEESVNVGLTVTGKEHESLLNEVEFINIDYTSQRPVDSGKIKRANGLELVLYGANAEVPILDVTSGVRSCIALAQGAVALGVWMDIDLEIKDIPDLLKVKRITTSMYMGATRTDGKKVQKVTTTA